MHVELATQPEWRTVHTVSRTLPEQIVLKNVLVPTDFSEESVKAVDYGATLARQFDGVLWLLHVVEPPPTYAGFEGIPVARNESEEMSEAEARMAEFAAKHVAPGVAVASLIRFGSALGEISAMAAAQDIDLVVISTHGRTGFSRAIYGSLAERILHRAPCPILVVREEEHDCLAPSPDGERKMLCVKRIVAPVDFTDCSRKAVRYAEAFARKFNAEIICLHVIKPEQPMILFETNGYHLDDEAKAQRNLTAQLAEMDSSIHVESLVATGDPHCEIVKTAAERETDLIIVGEHSRSGFKRLLLSSTTDEVIKRAPCPVLVVRQVEHEFIR